MKAAYNRRVKNLEALAKERRKAYENKPHTFRLIYADGTEEIIRDNLTVSIKEVESFMYLWSLIEAGEDIDGDLVVRIEDLTEGTVEDLKQTVTEAMQHKYTEEDKQFWDDFCKEAEEQYGNYAPLVKRR